MYDIGIVGAGPAGATLARLLADRFRVLLLDGGRPKCCGGILAPEAQKMLARLGLALPKSVLVDPQPFAVAVLDADNRIARKYSRQYVNVNRLAFDDWTRSLLPTSVDFRSAVVYKGAEPIPAPSGGYTVRFVENDVMHTEQVRTLIGADGAFSMVRREFFPETSSRPSPKRYVAMQDWFEPSEVRIESSTDYWNSYVGIFDRQFSDFYCWTIPKEGQLIVGGAFPPGPEIRRQFDDFKTKLESHGLFLGKESKREAGQILRPHSTSTICLGNGSVFLVGEAAGLISPSSAEGISAALASAVALSNALHRDREVDRDYRRRLRDLIWSIFRKNMKSPAMFAPWLRRWVMKSGLMSLD